MPLNRGKPSRKAVVWDLEHLLSLDGETKHCVELTARQISFLLTPMFAATWRTRWDKVADFEAALEIVYNTHAALLLEGCKDDIQYGDSDNRDYSAAISGSDFEDFLGLLEKLMPKFRLNGKLYEPVFDLVECGCGGDDGIAGDGDGGVSRGGTSGGWDNTTTLCDLITNMDYILGRVEDFNDSLANARTIGDAVVPDEYVPLLDQISDSFAEIDAVIQDDSFLDRARKVAAQTLPDPLPSSGLNQQQLRKFARKMPLLYEGAPVWAIFVLWAEFAKLQEINLWLPSISGTGDSIICTEAFSGTGRAPYELPNKTPSIEAIQGGQYGVQELLSSPILVAPNTGLQVARFDGLIENWQEYIVVVSGLGADINPESRVYANLTVGGNEYGNTHKVHEFTAGNTAICANNAGFAQTLLDNDAYFDGVNYDGAQGLFTQGIAVNTNPPEDASTLVVSADNSNNSNVAYTIEQVYLIVNLSI